MNIVFAAGYAPFSWLDENGKPQGILIETTERVLRDQIKLPVSVQVYPWKRAQQMVASGEADAFVTVPTLERSQYTVITDPALLKTEFKIFIAADNPKRSTILEAKGLAGLQKITNLSTGYLTGSGWHIEKLAGFPNIVTAAKLSEILKMVEAKRLDIYIDSSVIVDYHLMDYGLIGKVVPIGKAMDAPEWHLCIGNKSPYAAFSKFIETEIQKLAKTGQLERVTTSAVSRAIKPKSKSQEEQITSLQEQQQ